MRPSPNVSFVTLLAAALVLSACPEDPAPTDTSTGDSSAETTSDAGGDATADATPDAPPDATPDAVADGTPDAAPDASPDAAPDTVSDATPDAVPDALVDAAPDAADAQEDTAVPDGLADATEDVEVAAPPDATPDVGSDVAAPAVCQSACEATIALGCPNDDGVTLAECIAGCAYLSVSSCPNAAATLLACLENTTFSCGSNGMSQPDDCLTELEAVNTCYLNQTYCTGLCPSVVAAGCANAPADIEDCETSCFDIADGPCGTQYGAIVSCADNLSSVTFDCAVGTDSPYVVGCESENTALGQCLANP